MYKFKKLVEDESPRPREQDAAIPKSARSLPPAATILRLCRCMDCLIWDKRYDMCREYLFRRHMPREEYHPSMQRFWTNVGTVKMDQWRYCASYDGPRISSEVLVWPRHVAGNPVPTSEVSAAVAQLPSASAASVSRESE